MSVHGQIMIAYITVLIFQETIHVLVEKVTLEMAGKVDQVALQNDHSL